MSAVKPAQARGCRFAGKSGEPVWVAAVAVKRGEWQGAGSARQRPAPCTGWPGGGVQPSPKASAAR